MTKNTSSNRAVVPEANFQTERKRRRLYGQKDDRTAGTPDVRKFPERTVLSILINNLNS